ncbi:DUF3078 domain-containing protein [Flavobacteriaceae bacterium F89]|uniref:DUF3078 domain-containing protein n=1 Tax=Cerina litoralis TaxID=2874477 RepID=A0AAE3ES69_9FLAO|nr:DUF3078 domain-containing protein [Cerina litoralis]MCG2459199.1 DUF3078 domain-containing protein [Cerina litoralis]
MLKKTFFALVLITCTQILRAQDTIPTQTPVDSTSIDTLAIDTTLVDTIVIRSVQQKIKHIPRGVNLTNPVISFSKTKARTKEFKYFRVPSFWDNENQLGINLSEVAFVNWSAGGDNAISILGVAKFKRNYKFRYLNWENLADMRYGINIQEGRAPRKTEDYIRLSSTFSYRNDTISNWYYSVKANFNTQFTNGYKYPDRDNPISGFMAPGYFFLGAGTSYIPEGKKFNLYLSPLTQRATFVLNQDLANEGAFGVDPAETDVNGNIIREGKNVLMALGILVTNSWDTQLSKNIELKHRLSLYTDYLHDFGNIDLDWQLTIDMIVNQYVKATIGTQIIYDDDIKFDEVRAPDGTITTPGVPKIQFKQLLAVGLAYSF